VNAKLLRAVLTHVEDNPALFDPCVWGEADRDTGDVTDLGGRALLLSGWTLIRDNEFLSPDGTREISQSDDIAREARGALGLTEDEFWDGSDFDTLFDLDRDAAVARLRELTGQAEAAIANA
jgi:hypothetical protein